MTSQQSSTLSSSTVAVGVDVGSFNARVGTYDTNLDHGMVCANHDGHRETRVLPEGEGAGGNGNNAKVTVESLQAFYEGRLLKLASDTAHTKDLTIVSSISNGTCPEGWLEILSKFGTVITEAAAICLAYGVDPSTTTTTTTTGSTSRVLVLDGGASGLKATILSSCGGTGIWSQEDFSMLDTVHGDALVEPLAQAVALQFEQKHRFPRGEVWQSKKAKLKLKKACQQSLSTFQRMNNVAIHVDGLYEGMDCNVNISKPKWEHLSSKLANQVKTFCKELPPVDKVLIAGNLHDWITPIVKSILGADKVLSSNGMDPSEAVALGCTLHAYWNLQQQLSPSSSAATAPKTTTHAMDVPCSPVSIAIETPSSEESTTTVTLIAEGTPLPFMATHQIKEATAALELIQLEPNKKPLAKIEELEASSTLKLQLNEQGRLRIWVNGESLIIE